MVSKAVANTLRNQTREAQCQSLVAVYSLSEKGRDYLDILDFLGALETRCQVVSIERIGRSPPATSGDVTGEPRGRPLKLQLSAKVSCEQLIALAKPTYSEKKINVNVSRWLN